MRPTKRDGDGERDKERERERETKDERGRDKSMVLKRGGGTYRTKRIFS